MKTKFSPFLVGVFVLGGLLFGVGSLLLFSGANFFTKPQRFIVYFDESIHGLDLGSPVKLRGVRVGRVVDLNVRYDPRSNQSVVAVICELNRSMMRDEKNQLIDVVSQPQMEALVDQGLRAQLGVLGLATGLLYVELNFLDPRAYPRPGDTVPDSRYTVVPGVPSDISALRSSMTEILASIQRVDFPGLSKDLRALLVDTRKQVNALDLAALGNEWTRAGRSVTAFVESPELKLAITNVNKTVEELQQLIANIDAKVGPTAAELGTVMTEARKTLQTFQATAATARAFVAAQQGLGDEATRTLIQLSETASAIQRLADFIERNPNALITGKKPSP